MSDEITEYPQRPNPLPAESRQGLAASKRARRAFAVTFGPFVRAMRDAMDQFHAMREQGVEREHALLGLEAVLRDVWQKPLTRFGPKCGTCDDIGYEDLVCFPGHRCQREKCERKGEGWQHRYVEPCLCVAGDKFRKAAVSHDDAMAAAAKVSKPKRGWSKIGG